MFGCGKGTDHTRGSPALLYSVMKNAAAHPRASHPCRREERYKTEPCIFLITWPRSLHHFSVQRLHHAISRRISDPNCFTIAIRLLSIRGRNSLVAESNMSLEEMKVNGMWEKSYSEVKEDSRSREIKQISTSMVPVYHLAY